MDFFIGLIAFIVAFCVYSWCKDTPTKKPSIVANIQIHVDEDGNTILTKMVNDRRIGAPLLLPAEASPEKIKRTAEEMAEEVRQEYPSLR